MIFLNSASSAAALVFYLPGVCTHTDTEGKQRKGRVRNIFKISEKTQFLMNTLYFTLSNLESILVFPVEAHGLESVAPQDLRGQVGGSGLK